MDPLLIAFVIGVVLLAGTAQTVTGFGFALVAVPLLIVVLKPEEVIVFSAILATVNALLVSRGVWRSIPWRTVGTLIAGSLIGMPLGLLVLLLVPDDALRIAVSVISIVMALALAAGARFGGSGPRGEWTAGAVSGVLNTSTGMNGPPVVLYLTDQHLTPAAFRGALSSFFLAANVFTLASFGIVELLSWQPILLGLVALPALIPASIIGHAMLGRVTDETFRYLVLGLLIVTALTGMGITIARIAS